MPVLLTILLFGLSIGFMLLKTSFLLAREEKEFAVKALFVIGCLDFILIVYILISMLVEKTSTP